MISETIGKDETKETNKVKDKCGDRRKEINDKGKTEKFLENSG